MKHAKIVDEIYNDVLTDGIIGPDAKKLGILADGGQIIFETPPGCWGPMITPNLKGGHEVAVPVDIENAQVGDAVAIKIDTIEILSKASSSGVEQRVEGAFVEGARFVKKCPSCGQVWGAFEIKGVGQDAIRCKTCGASASPFKMVHGYTLGIGREVAITLEEAYVRKIQANAWDFAVLPKNSKQVPILLFGQADMPGVATRVRPHLGQLGTIPAVNIPDSKNAGDGGASLIGVPHLYAITQEQYETALTDGHLDVDSVRQGCIVIAPVKVAGGGVYAGDVHVQQGDGEVAGHTTDVSGKTTVTVSVLKQLTLEGPLLLPPEDDLPPLAKPWKNEEWEKVEHLAKTYDVEAEPAAPLKVIGSGPTINAAAERGFKRAANLFGMHIEEVQNRVTITGAVEIGRLPGVVQISMQVPLRVLEKLGIAELAIEHYDLPF
jgi:acetamidase/formamidase